MQKIHFTEIVRIPYSAVQKMSGYKTLLGYSKQSGLESLL